jgi:hypothetical protein
VIQPAAGENARCLLLAHATALSKQALNTSERERQRIPETHNLLALDSRLPNQASLSGVTLRHTYKADYSRTGSTASGSLRTVSLCHPSPETCTVAARDDGDARSPPVWARHADATCACIVIVMHEHDRYAGRETCG